jgi:hypothetical protein
MRTREIGGLTMVTLLALGTVPASAQSSWKITDAKNQPDREILTLRGSYLSSSSVRPNLTLVCSDGKLISSSFNTFIVAGKASERGFIRKSEKAPVLFRVGEQKEKFTRWQVTGSFRSLHPDSKFVREFVSSDHTVIEFLTSPSGEMTAEFDPSMTDLPRIRKACGLH